MPVASVPGIACDSLTFEHGAYPQALLLGIFATDRVSPRVRLHADIVKLDYKGERVALMERLVGRDAHRIDYRHIIHALVRKPGAFRRDVFRGALFPTLEFRRAYDALHAERSDQADLDYCASCTWPPAMARRPSARCSRIY
jgi:hypothetical protein